MKQYMNSVVDRTAVKVLAWYDNKWEYSSRLVDIYVFVSNN
jgi:glyceraldehyde-3-phosphate dehydrogenase/erythrose-4-phosphate dehydrogenase